jgi:hypothetical protein
MAISNSAFDGELTTTIAAWMNKELADLITGNNPAFLKMRERGNFKRGGHGTSYVESFYFPTLTGPQVEDIDNPYDEPEAQQTDGLTSFSFTRCEKEIDISVPLYSIEAQGPETEKYDVVQTATEINMAKFEENLNANFWAIPEGSTSGGSRTRLASIRTLINGGNASTTGAAVPPSLSTQDGLRAVVSATGATAVYTVGGINRAAAGASYICPNIYLSSDTLDMEILSIPYSQATRGADSPDLILVSPRLFDSITGFSTTGGASGGQFFGESKLAKLGYQAIRFRGADIVADHNVPTAGFLSTTTTALAYQAFYLNTKYMKMRYMSMKPEVRMVNDARPIKRWRARWSGQFTVRNPGRVQSVHANITP